MKKLLGILCILFLSSCATTVEPVSQASNPAKASSDVKIIYADADEIYIMEKKSSYLKRPDQDSIETSFNHCSLNKKNSYYLYHTKNPIPYNVLKGMDPNFKNTYFGSKNDMYEWRSFYFNDAMYRGYRFVCANTKDEALKKPFSFLN